MGQYWLVACPSQKEYAESLFAMKLGEMLFSRWPEFLVSLLRKPSNFSVRSCSHTRLMLSPRVPWVGRWAGEPILCVGDYLEPRDLPITEQHLFRAVSILLKANGQGISLMLYPCAPWNPNGSIKQRDCGTMLTTFGHITLERAERKVGDDTSRFFMFARRTRGRNHFLVVFVFCQINRRWAHP